ncbi:hypothetical protein Aperf_G00000032793 [Anoplocephala perfoliata]
MNKLCRRILFPVDDSTTCERGFCWYIKNCHRKGDEVILAYVISPNFTGGTNALDCDEAATGLAGDMVKACRLGTNEARRITDRYVQICKKNDIDYHIVALVGSKIGRAIVRAITENMVDCVVIGYHTMGPLKRALFGSSSSYVLKNSPVPVVVVPPTNAATTPAVK